MYITLDQILMIASLVIDLIMLFVLLGKRR